MGKGPDGDMAAVEGGEEDMVEESLDGVESIE